MATAPESRGGPQPWPPREGAGEARLLPPWPLRGPPRADPLRRAALPREEGGGESRRRSRALGGGGERGCGAEV